MGLVILDRCFHSHLTRWRLHRILASRNCWFGPVWRFQRGLRSGWWWLEHDFSFSIYLDFHHPNWLSYFSEGWLNRQQENLVPLEFSLRRIHVHLVPSKPLTSWSSWCTATLSLQNIAISFLGTFGKVLTFAMTESQRETGNILGWRYKWNRVFRLHPPK